MQTHDSRLLAASGDDELTREVVALANGLVGRMWAHHQARVAEIDLSGPEAKALRDVLRRRDVRARGAGSPP